MHAAARGVPRGAGVRAGRLPSGVAPHARRTAGARLAGADVAAMASLLNEAALPGPQGEDGACVHKGQWSKTQARGARRRATRK